MFRPLGREHLEGIIEIQLRILSGILEKQEISFEARESLHAYLMQEGYDLQFGARPLKRLIQKKVLDALALSMLREEVKPGMHIQIGVEDQKVVVSPKIENLAQV